MTPQRSVSVWIQRGVKVSLFIVAIGLFSYSAWLGSGYSSFSLEVLGIFIGIILALGVVAPRLTSKKQTVEQQEMVTRHLIDATIVSILGCTVSMACLFLEWRAWAFVAGITSFLFFIAYYALLWRQREMRFKNSSSSAAPKDTHLE